MCLISLSNSEITTFEVYELCESKNNGAQQEVLDTWIKCAAAVENLQALGGLTSLVTLWNSTNRSGFNSRKIRIEKTMFYVAKVLRSAM